MSDRVARRPVEILLRAVASGAVGGAVAGAASTSLPDLSNLNSSLVAMGAVIGVGFGIVVSLVVALTWLVLARARPAAVRGGGPLWSAIFGAVVAGTLLAWLFAGGLSEVVVELVLLVGFTGAFAAFATRCITTRRVAQS